MSVTGMDVVGERVTAKASNLPAGATQVSYQWQYSSTKTGTFSDIKYGGNTNSYEISEEDEDYYLRCKVTTSSSKGKVPDAYSETIGKVYVFDWSNYPTGSYRPHFNGNSLACCAAPYDSSTQIPSLGEGDYASIVFDNELSDIPQGNITYRWFKCAGLGNGAQLVAKELGSSPSLSLSGLQGSCINCEVTLTVNGKSKTFVPKAICKRSWHIEAEPSAKPLRHKGTDLIRLETPLPAITVYAVKGAPTGETSWDNIDLTLREISEATVEKQEEALRKKRSLSSRCPSYKNGAPAGRQIKQTKDTGFETPTKPHGILGRLKGLFEKLRK